MTDEYYAKKILQCMDLTSLNKDDSNFKIEELAKKGKTPHGDVAALCVFQKFIKEIKNKTDLPLATVVNFPHGVDDAQKISQDIKDCIEAGASEVDIVFPYKSYLAKDFDKIDEFLEAIYSIEKRVTTKIILETSELGRYTNIIDATKLCLEAGANFIKTSTGKTNQGATPEVANIILETIQASPRRAGFKASGGIKTLEEARKYVILAETIMGHKWVKPLNFRIGASSLLTEVLKCLSKT